MPGKLKKTNDNGGTYTEVEGRKTRSRCSGAVTVQPGTRPVRVEKEVTHRKVNQQKNPVSVM